MKNLKLMLISLCLLGIVSCNGTERKAKKDIVMTLCMCECGGDIFNEETAYYAIPSGKSCASVEGTKCGSKPDDKAHDCKNGGKITVQIPRESPQDPDSEVIIQ